MKLDYVIFDLKKKDLDKKPISLGEKFDFFGYKRVTRGDNSFFVQHDDDPTFYPIRFFLSYCAALSFAENNAVTQKFETLVIN